MVARSPYDLDWLRRASSVRRGTPYQWSYKTPGGVYALDAPTSPVERDESRMSLSCILATEARDREGDILYVGGVDLTAHRLLPVAMADHGMYYPLPIGKTRTPELIYTVMASPDEGVLRQTTFFNQSDEVAAQLYDLGCRGLLGNSIGYRPIRVEPLRPDPDRGWPRRRDGTGGQRLLQTEMTEATWTAVPANPECIQEELSRDMIGGKRLADCVKAMLRPWAPPRRAFLYTGTGERKGKAMSDDRDKERKKPAQKDDEPEPDEHGDEPYSAQVHRAFLNDAKAMHEHFSGALKANENKGSHKAMCKALNHLRSSMESVLSAHGKGHPSLGLKMDLPNEMDHKSLYMGGAGADDEDEDEEEKPAEAAVTRKGKAEDESDDMDEETAGKCLLILKEVQSEQASTRDELRRAVGR